MTCKSELGSEMLTPFTVTCGLTMMTLNGPETWQTDIRLISLFLRKFCKELTGLCNYIWYLDEVRKVETRNLKKKKTP